MRRHLETVRAFISGEELIDAGSAVLVGLSGGVDSVVLVEMLQRLGFDVRALHVNYGLRNAASDEDEHFVRSFCTRLAIGLQIEHVDTRSIAEERGTSVQEAARDLRYEAFDRSAGEAAIPRVAVGHHRDDQAETVLLHLFRGSGPEGLAGMPARRPLRTGSGVHLIRPLLCLRRGEIEAYAASRSLAWREDATNLKTTYRRGAIRTRIFPLIEEHFGAAATDNIVRSAELMRAYVESGLSDDVREAFSAASEAKPSWRQDPEVLGQLDLSVLRALNPALRGRIVLEAIRRWLPALGATRRTVEEIEALMEVQPGRRLVHPTGIVWRERERLLFVAGTEGADRISEEGATHPADSADQLSDGGVMVLSATEPARTPVGVVDLKMDVKVPSELSNGSRNEEYVDAERLGDSLIVRRWAPGDRFIPLGMDRPKKISDFLTDEKVPPHRREKVLVVLAGEEIVWVVGHRISNSLRVRPNTKRVARFRFRPVENTSTTSA